jgi:hypothetical protein
MFSSRYSLSGIFLMLLLSSCIGELPLTIYIDQTASTSSASKPMLNTAAAFNYTIEMYGADNTRGVIRFTQKKADDIIILNIYAHDLPADHRYHLQYAIDTELNGQCVAANWLNAGNDSTDFDMEADRTGAVIEEYKIPASRMLNGSSFDIRFQLRDHTSEIVLTSNCFAYRAHEGAK